MAKKSLSDYRQLQGWMGLFSDDNVKLEPETFTWTVTDPLPQRINFRHCKSDEFIKSFNALKGTEITILKGRNPELKGKILRLPLDGRKLPNEIFTDLNIRELSMDISKQEGNKKVTKFPLSFIINNYFKNNNHQLIQGKFRATFQGYVKLTGDVQYEDTKWDAPNESNYDEDYREVVGPDSRWKVEGECVFYLPYHSSLSY